MSQKNKKFPLGIVLLTILITGIIILVISFFVERKLNNIGGEVISLEPLSQQIEELDQQIKQLQQKSLASVFQLSDKDRELLEKEPGLVKAIYSLYQEKPYPMPADVPRIVFESGVDIFNMANQHNIRVNKIALFIMNKATLISDSIKATGEW